MRSLSPGVDNVWVRTPQVTGNSDEIRSSAKSDGQVKHRSDLDELLGISTTSMDFDVSSVEGEPQLQEYMQVLSCGGNIIST